ncbi:MAG: DUF1924 domain-containing protein [Myxococcaceae bacterium]
MKRIKVWDLAVRLSHLAFAVLVLGAFLTNEEDALIPLHTRLGLVLLGVVLFRVAWGFVGPKHARFTDFVRGPRAVLDELKVMLRGRASHWLGHNPVGAVMVVALLVVMLVVTVTGVIVSQGPEWSGALGLSKDLGHAVKELHEAAAYSLPVLLVFHVGGVIASSLLEKQNLVAGIVTGFKNATPSEDVEAAPSFGARAGRFLVSALVALAAVLALWRLMPIGEAEAATPLTATWEEAARREDPSFTGFSAARGKALYFEEHDGKNGKVSCATCHTTDPRQPGRSPVGKVIEPLSPAVNPARFSDLAKAEKWFDRNCKQVLGRVCTARERGDFQAFVEGR